jgi:ligand-binding SRPBCC domain-containing protein
MRGSVTVHMAASPERVWELVSDVTNTGRFSPETFECVWCDGPTEPKAGARFRGHVKRNGIGPVYWTNCVVTASEPGREFAFGVVTPKGAVMNTWSYRFEPAGDGTDVTESFELTPTRGLRLYWAVLGWARGRHNENDMRTTLERIKTVVETPDSTP